MAGLGEDKAIIPTEINSNAKLTDRHRTEMSGVAGFLASFIYFFFLLMMGSGSFFYNTSLYVFGQRDPFFMV